MNNQKFFFTLQTWLLSKRVLCTSFTRAARNNEVKTASGRVLLVVLQADDLQSRKGKNYRSTSPFNSTYFLTTIPIPLPNAMIDLYRKQLSFCFAISQHTGIFNWFNQNRMCRTILASGFWTCSGVLVLEASGIHETSIIFAWDIANSHHR